MKTLFIYPEIRLDEVENLDKLLGRRLPWKDFY